MRKPVAVVLLVAATLGAAGILSVGPGGAARADQARYTVLQMNLCLSGSAGCWSESTYPAVVREAEDQVRDARPEAVTLNEACRADAQRIARRTGYRMRFAPVLVDGAPLPCVDPLGRGVFGVAVLTRAPVATSDSREFSTASGVEGRRWLCVTTDRPVTVCTAHLDTRDSVAGRNANDLQCTELRHVLGGYAERGATVFGGDVNRHAPCAPDSMRAREDTAAGQLPGIQHIYVSTSLGAPSPWVAPAAYTDHDYFAAEVRPLPALAA